MMATQQKTQSQRLTEARQRFDAEVDAEFGPQIAAAKELANAAQLALCKAGIVANALRVHLSNLKQAAAYTKAGKRWRADDTVLSSKTEAWWLSAVSIAEVRAIIEEINAEHSDDFPALCLDVCISSGDESVMHINRYGWEVSFTKPSSD